MIQIKAFTFNEFQENTYILSDETGECVIIDPGCNNDFERRTLKNYIESNQLKPLHLLNTHCHIDHILGNKFISDTYNLLPCIHKNDFIVLKSASIVGQKWGIPVEESPEPVTFLEEGNVVDFGKSSLEILFLPGHSPGSIGFLNKNEGFIISGDVLFYESIGRTDLPGGNLEQLLESIRKKLFCLDSTLKVYSGHGPHTDIGHEKSYNPFLSNSFSS